MLIRLQQFAIRFAWLRRPLLLGCLLMPFVIAFLVFGSDGNSEDVALMPSVVLLAWLLLLHTALALFREVPAVRPEDGWWRRTKTRGVRALYSLLALLVMAITIAVLITSYQLVSTWVYLYVL